MKTKMTDDTNSDGGRTFEAVVDALQRRIVEVNREMQTLISELRNADGDVSRVMRDIRDKKVERQALGEVLNGFDVDVSADEPFLPGSDEEDDETEEGSDG